MTAGPVEITLSGQANTCFFEVGCLVGSFALKLLSSQASNPAKKDPVGYVAESNNLDVILERFSIRNRIDGLFTHGT